MQVAQRGDRHATAGLLEEESMIQLQLQEARRSLQMARDAAEALRLALGAQKLDDDMPEVMEHQRLAAQETELVRALESTRDRRAAICEGRVASALKIIEEHDRRFAKYIARGPEDEWQDHGNWLTYHVPNRAMRQLSVNSQGPAEIECQPDPFTSKPLAKDIEMALAGHIAQPCEGPGAGAKRECDNNAPGSPKKRLAFAPPGTAEGKNPLELSSAPHAPLFRSVGRQCWGGAVRRMERTRGGCRRPYASSPPASNGSSAGRFVPDLHAGRSARTGPVCQRGPRDRGANGSASPHCKMRFH